MRPRRIIRYGTHETFTDLGYLDYIIPEWAAKVIRHLIKTGKVNWKKFQPEVFRRARS